MEETECGIFHVKEGLVHDAKVRARAGWVKRK
jgi:hypothetical protein